MNTTLPAPTATTPRLLTADAANALSLFRTRVIRLTPSDMEPDPAWDYTETSTLDGTHVVTLTADEYADPHAWYELGTALWALGIGATVTRYVRDGEVIAVDDPDVIVR